MNTGIPNQVQAQSDKADQMLKGLPAGEKPEPAKKIEDGGAKPPEVEETVDSLKAKLTESEHKFSVLQGKYNAEIQTLKDDPNLLTRLKGQVKSLGLQLQEANGKLQEQNNLILDLKKQITAKPAEVPKDDDPLSALSEEDRDYLRDEGFEDKTLEIVGKLVKNAKKGEIPAPVNVADIKKEVQLEEKQRRQKIFWKKFTDEKTGVPDWQEINSSDAFNDWLDDTAKRSELQTAQDEDDYETAIQVFNDFKKSAKPKKPKINPEEHIEPSISVVSQTPPDGGAPAGKIYTRQEIKQFYQDVVTGKYKGKDAEMKTIDADILKADREGRIK